jgi:hypothetical protein
LRQDFVHRQGDRSNPLEVVKVVRIAVWTAFIWSLIA